MSAYSTCDTLPRTRSPGTRELTRRARRLWRDVGIGLVFAVLGLGLTGLAVQGGGAWLNADLQRPVVRQDVTTAPALFSPDALAVP